MRVRRRMRWVLRTLLAVVLIAAGLTAVLMWQKMHASGKIREFDRPKLPVFYTLVGKTRVNAAVGYTMKQNVRSQRDSLIALGADKQIMLEIEPNQEVPESIGYEITSLADGSFVENGNARNLVKKDGVYTAVIEVSAPMLMGREYAVQFSLNLSGDKKVYYYTRVILETGTNLTKYLQFASEFYQNCLDKNKSESIAARMESESGGAAGSSFAHITINSSMDRVTWGKLSPKLEEKAVPKIKEINPETASLEMEYILSAKTEEGNTEYYFVQDFYRLRMNQGQVVLIDLDRRTDQIFNPNLPVLKGNYVDLGVRDESVAYALSPKAKKVAFVAGSELYLLGSGKQDRPTQVFSFRGDTKPTLQTENKKHKIQICNVTDDGDITFVVYGYMSAGVHEGTTGVGVYQYNAGKNLLEERLFMASDESYELLNYYLSKLSYSNQKNELYLYTGLNLLRVSVNSGKYEVLLSDLEDSRMAASKDQRYVAWMNHAELNESTKLNILATESGKEQEIQAPEGEKIRILGYFNEDIIYGLASDADILTDAAGNQTFGMYKIVIQGMDGSIKKEYAPEQTRITRVNYTETGNLELELSSRTDNGYVPAGNDQIVNYIKTTNSTLQFKSEANKRTGSSLHMPFTAGNLKEGRMQISRLADASGRLSLNLPNAKDDTEHCFVYAEGGLFSVQKDANEALRLADAHGGVVLGKDQSYLYERGNWKPAIRLNRNTVPQQLLAPTLDVQAIQNLLGDEYEVVNFSGVSTIGIRYQFSKNYPVIARLNENKTVLLLGYDIFENLWYYDPEAKKEVAIGKNDSAAQFAQMGNVFISYYKK